MTPREMDKTLEEIQDRLVDLTQAGEDVNVIYHLQVIIRQIHDLRESLVA